jgi:deoxyribonuclease-4
MRVREVLNVISVKERNALKKLLPEGLVMPTVDASGYPSAVLACFPKEQSYSCLGCVAETLLRLPVVGQTVDALCGAIKQWFPSVEAEALGKVRKSIQTPRFLRCIQHTRQEMDRVVVGGGEYQFDQVVRHGDVEGHPDMRTVTQIFEVKLTGQLKQNWLEFLLQVFAYGALDSSVTDLYLVLPLHQTVWHADIRAWKGREAFRSQLQAVCTRVTGAVKEVNMEAMIRAALMVEMYRIGHHASKLKSLPDTIRSLPDSRKPYQIFLGAPHMARMNIADAELAAASAIVQERRARVYIHSQYLINLCNPSDTWHTDLLAKNVKYGVAMGARGVVVHVGKSLKAGVPEAIEVMRKAITKVMADATADCPVLLETPAGQGSETLTDAKEFMDFVESFADPRVRACVDTCHIFACGHNPVDYITSFLQRSNLLKLIHYNDSATPCGSCVDRHAYIGSGHIGIETMNTIATLCSQHGLPMVIE